MFTRCKSLGRHINFMPNYIQKVCKHHGLTKFRVYFSKAENRNKYYCILCSSDTIKHRRQNIKQKIVNLLGGKCELCGYNKCIRALELHHKDPTEKEFSLSNKGINYSEKKVLQEIKKCMLVCANCHRELHSD